MRKELPQIRQGAIRSYQSEDVKVYQYTCWKADLASQRNAWLSTGDIGLSIQWFLHDQESPLCDSIEIVRSDILGDIGSLYKRMMNKGHGNPNALVRSV